MPTLTNAQCLEALPALRALSRELLPVTGALRIRRILRALAPHVEDVEAERGKLLRAYCRLDDQGELVVERNEHGLAHHPLRDADAQQALDRAHRDLMAGTWEHGWAVRPGDLWGNGWEQDAERQTNQLPLILALYDLWDDTAWPGEGVAPAPSNGSPT